MSNEFIEFRQVREQGAEKHVLPTGSSGAHTFRKVGTIQSEKGMSGEKFGYTKSSNIENNKKDKHLASLRPPNCANLTASETTSTTIACTMCFISSTQTQAKSHFSLEAKPVN